MHGLLSKEFARSVSQLRIILVCVCSYCSLFYPPHYPPCQTCWMTHYQNWFLGMSTLNYTAQWRPVFKWSTTACLCISYCWVSLWWILNNFLAQKYLKKQKYFAPLTKVKFTCHCVFFWARNNTRNNNYFADLQKASSILENKQGCGHLRHLREVLLSWQHDIR